MVQWPQLPAMGGDELSYVPPIQLVLRAASSIISNELQAPWGHWNLALLGRSDFGVTLVHHLSLALAVSFRHRLLRQAWFCHVAVGQGHKLLKRYWRLFRAVE